MVIGWYKLKRFGKKFVSPRTVGAHFMCVPATQTPTPQCPLAQHVQLHAVLIGCRVPAPACPEFRRVEFKGVGLDSTKSHHNDMQQRVRSPSKITPDSHSALPPSPAKSHSNSA